MDDFIQTALGVATHPLILGPALYLLTSAPQQYRSQAIAPLLHAGLTSDGLAHTITVLKVLLVYGANRQLTNVLNGFAFRNWRWTQPKTPWKWDSEVAVVTGGAGDIAAHVVRNLVARGVAVALLDIRPAAADILALPKVKFYQCDLTSADAVKAANAAIVAQQGTPTIVINNAGIGTVGNIFQLAQSELELVFKVNVLAHYYTAQAFLPGMIARGKGHILTVASMASYVGVPGITHYCSSKAAALSFYEGLTQELQHRLDAPFISTSCVHPIWVQGAMTGAISAGLHKAGDALITQELVAREVTDRIWSGQGGHVTIPRNDPRLRFATAMRGMPSWLNIYGNSTLRYQTAQIGAAGAENYARSRGIVMDPQDIRLK